MTTFVVEIRYTSDRELLERTRPAHREYARSLAERGVLLAGGPLVDGTGGLLVYATADRDELDSLLAADPYTEAGVIAETTVREWKPLTGSWLG
ncbi:YciI family protein [Actinopolyspora mortivallis]|uniref:YCII-related domain-containing protein n=1 Tax=Actinopolyspora mortivallis TaxID=33906 RepID=A0A2T0GUH1_ACTMO|nr:YciI family protein [Actinopolyspora mortivallis]PRW62759.1 hypothetical protein CEP50_13555 [Actinopolyspora mortivallis]